jgi:hypothetical protein
MVELSPLTYVLSVPPIAAAAGGPGRSADGGHTIKCPSG